MTALAQGNVSAIHYIDDLGKRRIYAFAAGADGHLYANWWDGAAWHWGDQGTPPGTSVKAGIRAITYLDPQTQMRRIYVFAAGGDGHLYVNWWDGSAWHWADQNHPFGSFHVFGNPAVVTYTENGTQRIYVFTTLQSYLGTNFVKTIFCVNYWDGTAWHWETLDTLPGAPNYTANVGATTYKEAGQQRLYAFVLGEDDVAASGFNSAYLTINYWDGSGWKWAKQGYPPASFVRPLVGTPEVITTVQGGVRHIYGFVTNIGDTQLVIRYWDGHDWHWSDHGKPPSLLISGQPAAVSYNESGGVRYTRS